MAHLVERTAIAAVAGGGPAEVERGFKFLGHSRRRRDRPHTNFTKASGLCPSPAPGVKRTGLGFQHGASIEIGRSTNPLKYHRKFPKRKLIASKVPSFMRTSLLAS